MSDDVSDDEVRQVWHTLGVLTDVVNDQIEENGLALTMTAVCRLVAHIAVQIGMDRAGFIRMMGKAYDDEKAGQAEPGGGTA